MLLRELMAKLQYKQALCRIWKQRWATEEEFGDVAQAWSSGVRKVKANPELIPQGVSRVEEVLMLH